MKSLLGRLLVYFRDGGCSRLLLKGISVIIAMAICGSIYQNIALGYDRKKYPPPGQTVDSGGFRLHIYCLGEGSPTVILESGLGGNINSWILVQEEIAKTTHVCAYDRAGLGWSDGVKDPMSTTDVAQTLRTLLENANVDGPYIMVGHSAGGVHVRTFNRLFPEQVAGMVLVDSSHENQRSNYHTSTIEIIRRDWGWKQCEILTAIGITRLVMIASVPTPDPALQAEIAIHNRAEYCHAVGNEVKAFDKDSSQSTPPQTLGDLPLIVLTAGLGTSPHWNGLQEELASLSTNSTHITVENSGHTIQLSQPDVVINAVKQLVDQVRQKTD